MFQSFRAETIIIIIIIIIIVVLLLSFLVEISNRLATISGDARETSFLFQRVSVLIQRFNQIAFRGTLIDGMTPKVNHSRFDFNLMFLTLGIFTTEGTIKLLLLLLLFLFNFFIF